MLEAGKHNHGNDWECQTPQSDGTDALNPVCLRPLAPGSSATAPGFHLHGKQHNITISMLISTCPDLLGTAGWSRQNGATLYVIFVGKYQPFGIQRAHI